VQPRYVIRESGGSASTIRSLVVIIAGIAGVTATEDHADAVGDFDRALTGCKVAVQVESEPGGIIELSEAAGSVTGGELRKGRAAVCKPPM
jgi:hypothetical protein